MELEKSPLQEQQSKCVRQDFLVNVKIDEQKYDEKQNIFMISK